MVTWEQFEKWLRDHDLPTTTVLRIELVPARGGEIHLVAKTLKLGEHGSPIAHEVPDETDTDTPDVLTETLVRPLVYLPGDEPTEA